MSLQSQRFEQPPLRATPSGGDVAMALACASLPAALWEKICYVRCRSVIVT